MPSTLRRRRPSWRRWTLLALGAAGVLVVLSPLAYLGGREAVIQSRLSSHWELIQAAADDQGLDPALVQAVIRVESKGDPQAVSGKQARGLMQITPITETEVRQRFGLQDGDVMDPAFNIEIGTRYLAYLLDRFDGNLRLALAAYHMGPTRVARVRRAHPDLTSDQLIERYAGPYTRQYVKDVLALLE